MSPISGTADWPGPPESNTKVPTRGPVAGTLVYVSGSVPPTRPLWSSDTVSVTHWAPFVHTASARVGAASRPPVARTAIASARHVRPMSIRAPEKGSVGVGQSVQTRHTSCMPGLEELGWLQFERLCELVLEADAGVDPTRWEGSADSARQLVCEDELSVNGRPLAPPVLIRCLWRRDAKVATPPDRFNSVVTFANQPACEIGDIVYGEAELFDAIRLLPGLRMRLPSILSLDAAPPDSEALRRSTIDVEATRELAK